MLAAGGTLPRDMTEDVSVRVTHPREETFVFPKGSRLIIDMIAAGHDPHTFPDPEQFLPERWAGVSEPQVLMFGQGPRACVGRKFAHVEVLTFLSLLLRDWHLDIVVKEGETGQDVHQRVLDSAGRIGLSFGIGPVDLKLRARCH
ncbi:hypothetical protein EIP86_010429 [Pleurotus ostreatoroseus]|nr:hypothetical protein EIP86_010429 [Pleurotus ostreatoroseus]